MKDIRAIPLKAKMPLRTRLTWTILIHLLSAALFWLIYAQPALYAFVQSTTITRSGLNLGMLLIMLPGTGVMLLWNGADVLRTSKVSEKLLLLSWYALNAGTSLVYLFGIHYLFRYH